MDFGPSQFQEQPPTITEFDILFEPSDFAGSSGSTAGSSGDFGQLRDGGHWVGGSNGLQQRRHSRNQHYGSNRMSPYTQPPSFQFNNTSGPSRRQWNWKVCSTCRYQSIKCDGSQPRCGPCQRNYIDNCDYTDSSRNLRADTDFRPEEGSREYSNAQALSSDYDTTNYGEGSHTYNGSRVYNNRKFDRSSSTVVHVHVHESGSTSTSSRSPSSSSNVAVTPSTSQGTGSDSAISDRGPKPGRELTRSEQYASLLLGCGIGYPLWKPIPRRTTEAEYVVSIGDVGVISDGLPFNTLFNITQPSDSLANKDGIPEGVHPPCILHPRWLTVIDRYHQEWTTLICPKNSVSCQTVQKLDGSRVYNYTLSDKQGALLGLPKGGVLKNLERKGEFKERIQKHWRQWYDFSERQGYLEEHQALYVVTGVEQCSTWAIAAWDHAPGDRSDSVSLKFAVDESNGSCSWIHSTARCESQSSAKVDPTGGDDAAKQTVFVRGFWINKFSGRMSSSAPSMMRLGGLDSGQDDDNHFGGNGGPVNGSSSSFLSMSTFGSGSGSASSHKGGCSDDSAPHTETSDFVHEPQVQSLSVDLQDFFNFTGESPCEIINHFAFAVVSRIQPAVLNTDYIIFSHDDDWIGIMQELDDGFPAKLEIIKRICCEFKFVVEDGAIYTTKLMDHDIKLVRQGLIPVQAPGSDLSVILEFRETQRVPEESGQPLAMTWSCAPTLHPASTQDEGVLHHEFPHQNNPGSEAHGDARSGSSSLLPNNPVASKRPPRNIPPESAHHHFIPAMYHNPNDMDHGLGTTFESPEVDWNHLLKNYQDTLGPGPGSDSTRFFSGLSSDLLHPSPGSTLIDSSPYSDLTLFDPSPSLDHSPLYPELSVQSDEPLFEPASPKSISSVTAAPVTSWTPRNLTTPELVPLDAPTQRRRSATRLGAKKQVPVMFVHKGKVTGGTLNVKDGKLEGDGDLPPLNSDATEEEQIEYKRRQNTAAARKSRKRKLEYVPRGGS
ncbi:hypothetical protein E1B28_011574 [Marasmius oreades]|uniref:Zn(2)-C6 fungal-type domain-containing protein n=1 Tax=Marasmius oreades TaxID=181124 RepID=A0A9P7RVG4_9AGAR|nr:uncharacterized protein E1B28_011574 [Marasmius oreades]KAG7089946.1 hypothetical protein E1B28_011574 [Marasmius oreades]